MDLFRNFGMFGMPNQEPYNRSLKCSSGITLTKNKGEEINKGGKIILPSSALIQLTQLNIQYPMLFKLTNTKTGRFSHCGVLEFIAEEGRCILPYWMMDNLGLDEFDIVKVEYVSLPTATFAKFQPQSVDFLDISNPKAVLENALRSFATLTKDEIIQISYNQIDYRLKVLELKPFNAVSIIECDMDVDFAPPPGYQEPTYKKPDASKTESVAKDYSKYIKKKETVPYAGEGYRLDGKTKKPEAAQASNVLKEKNEIEFQRGIPNYEYQIGTISFNRHPSKKSSPEDEKQKDKPKEITGRRLKDIK